MNALKGIPDLDTLYLGGCIVPQNGDALSGLPNLHTLYLIDCPALQNVDGLRGLSALQHLDLSGCLKLPATAVADLRAALPTARIEY